MKVIVGLGNPGEQYKLTRHNLGFIIVDALVAKLGLAWEINKKLKSEIVKTSDLILVKPQTFMNLSGEAISAILNYYKLAAEDLIIIHDDLDIEFGKFKLATDSRAAGHNGVQSIFDQLKTQQLFRYRMGIQNESLKNIPAEKFVLEKFNKEELEKLPVLIRSVMEKIL